MAAQRVSLLGLHDVERETIASCLRLSAHRVPRYELTPLLDECDWLIADAEHAPSVQLVLAAERLAGTLFVGAGAPAGARTCIARPIDPRELLRALDALVTQTGVAPPEPGQGVAAAPARRPAPAAEPGAPRALIVDDSEMALRFLESRLQRWGLALDRALSSGRAVELLGERRYAFVFLDVELGTGSELDGIALCRRIKGEAVDGAAAPVVFLVSAHDSEADRARGSQAGCDAYLGKPLDEVALHRLLLRHGLKPRTQAVGAAPPQ